MEEMTILKTQKWLTKKEIKTLLEKVSFIILAQPNLDERSFARIHFTVFFHTSEPIPDAAISSVGEKLAKDFHLSDIMNFSYTMGNVAFAKTNEPKPMPYHLPDQEQHELPEGDTQSMFIFDFDANAHEGFENIKKSMTGWTYIYED